MTRVVVADAGPLIALARIARLQLLHHLYGPVVVPTAVLDELRVDSARPGAQALAEAQREGWLEVAAPSADATQPR